MLVDLEVFYLGHLKNFYTIQYNEQMVHMSTNLIMTGLDTAIPLMFQ